MENKFEFSTEERAETIELYTWLKDQIGNSLQNEDEQKIRKHMSELMEQQHLQRDVFGLNPVRISNSTDTCRGNGVKARCRVGNPSPL